MLYIAMISICAIVEGRVHADKQGMSKPFDIMKMAYVKAF